MTNPDISTIVTSILSAFGNGRDLFRNMQKKQEVRRRPSEKSKRDRKPHSPRKKKRRDPDNNAVAIRVDDVDDERIQASLERGPTEIKGEYERSVRRLGERFKKGDELSQGSLAHTLLVLNAGLMKLISTCLSTDGTGYTTAGAVGRRSLLTLSDSAAADAITALDELRQRLLNASTPLPNTMVMPAGQKGRQRSRSASQQRTKTDHGRPRASSQTRKNFENGNKQPIAKAATSWGAQKDPIAKPDFIDQAVRGMWVRSSKKGSSISLATTAVTTHQPPPQLPKKQTNMAKQCDLEHNQGHPAFAHMQTPGFPNGQLDFRQYNSRRYTPTHAPAASPSIVRTQIANDRRTPNIAKLQKQQQQQDMPLSPLVPLSQNLQIPSRGRARGASAMSISSASTKLGEIPSRLQSNEPPPSSYTQNSRPVVEVGYQRPRVAFNAGVKYWKKLGREAAESSHLRERYVKFNVQELMRTAARATNKQRCVGITKLAEGGFNKIFLLTMDDGHEVIARIPPPIAGPSYYSTASEVATMDFLRNVLEIPVPRVLTYSATADNPVEAEYIIMERLYGDSLSQRWPGLSTAEMKDVLKQIIHIETKMFSYKFPAYGSLYRTRDVAGISHIRIPGSDQFCIGPIAKRQFWFGERKDLSLDRGPWTKPEDPITAPAQRESAWLKKFAKPQPRRTWLLHTDEPIDPHEHHSLLSKYLSIGPYLAPKDPDLSIPILRHPDLSLPNIFLAPKSTKILAIIDWQDAAILPIFLQAGYPAFCEHDLTRPQTLEQPKLPDDFENLSPVDKQKAWTKYRLEQTKLYYTAVTGLENDLHFKTLQYPHLGLRQYLISQAGFPWDADFINLKASLVAATRSWKDISSSPEDPCPISFTEEEQRQALDDAAEWNESADFLSKAREAMGIDFEGGTEPGNFEFAREMNLRFRMEMVRQADEHERELAWRTWPYKDDGDESPVPVLMDE
ncbi:hypothetical protein FQN50_003163 [Emmonsiellopsis sp. PD_5]|nr:hypothetical protein FQN50_003163 [Emmonsiellopsis sp. PD_5]